MLPPLSHHVPNDHLHQYILSRGSPSPYTACELRARGSSQRQMAWPMRATGGGHLRLWMLCDELVGQQELSRHLDYIDTTVATNTSFAAASAATSNTPYPHPHSTTTTIAATSTISRLYYQQNQRVSRSAGEP